MAVSTAARKAYAKSGVALPNGKFPIPDKAHLLLAIRYAHDSDVPYATVKAHIEKRARALGVTLKNGKAVTAAAPAKGAYGRSASLKWPWLYDKLRAKGYDKEKAARISNSRIRVRKKGRLNVLKAEQAHNPKVLARLAKADKAGKHVTRRQLTSSATRAFEFAGRVRPPGGA